MYCRYTRVMGQCSRQAAEWQLEFTHLVTDTAPKSYQYVTRPDGTKGIDISNCDQLSTGDFLQVYGRPME